MFNHTTIKASYTFMCVGTVLAGVNGCSKISDATSSEISVVSRCEGVSDSPRCKKSTDSGQLTAGAFSESTSVGSTGFTLNWSAAAGNESASTSFQYFVCSGASAAAVNSVANCEAATSVMTYTAHTFTKTITERSPATTYYYNVVVKDAAGNKALYDGKTQSTTTDPVPPTAGNSGTIFTASVTDTTLTLNWTSATDNITATASLLYEVRRSTLNNIQSVANAEANGTIVGSYTANIATLNVTGLIESTTYYFNVIAKDAAGNKTAYVTKSQATGSYCSQSTRSSNSPYAAGTGTGGSPFEICTATQLNAIGSTVADWSKSFILKGDINMTSVTYNQIGNDATAFTGTFDGNYKTISNLTHGGTGTNDSSGFIGRQQGGTIKRLKLTSLTMNSTKQNVGGLVGLLDSGTISQCFVQGTISSSSSVVLNVGGLVGYGFGFTIDQSAAEVSITAPGGGDANAGGLIGRGDNGANITISDSYSRSSINCASSISGSCGGMIGYINDEGTATITNSFSGSTIATGAANYGAFIGFAENGFNYTGIFYDSTLAGTGPYGVVPKTTAEMQTQNTFTSASWNFTTIWIIPGSSTYPILRWQQ